MLATLIILAVIILDQVTKYFAVTLLAPIRSYPIIDGVFELHFVRNRGAAWGILADSRWIFMTISIISILLMLIYLFFSSYNHKLFTVSLSLIIGGGIGNMIDRLFYVDGAVVDFLYFKLIDFPVFNIADCAVTVGAGLLIFYLVYFEIIKPMKNGKDNTDGKADMQ